MKLAKPYDPSPNQNLFHGSPALARYYCGALGAGKSTTLIVEAIALSVEYPGNIGLLTRDSLPELTSTTLTRFFEYCPDDLILDHKKKERTIYLRTIGEKHSTILYHPFDDVDRFKSLDLGWWAADEADKMKEEVFLMLLGRLRHPDVHHSALLASNPTTVHHWLYKTFFQSTDPDMALFRAKTIENKANLPQGYIERLMKAYPVDWQKRYLEGEPGTIMDGTSVFPDFRMDLHVKPCSHKPGRTLMRGWDFGYHFPMCVFAEFDELGRFLIIDMISGRDEDLELFKARVVQHTAMHYAQATIKDYCDPNGVQKKDNGKSSIQTLNDGPHRIFPDFRYSLIEERASEIRRLMREIIYREPAFQIHPKNKEGIDCLIGYQYKKNKDGLSLDTPDKDNVHDHFIDAVGYILACTTLQKKMDNQSGYEAEHDRPKQFRKNIGRVGGGGRWQNGKRINYGKL